MFCEFTWMILCVNEDVTEIKGVQFFGESVANDGYLYFFKAQVDGENFDFVKSVLFTLVILGAISANMGVFRYNLTRHPFFFSK